jgi:hypothetical protein
MLCIHKGASERSYRFRYPRRSPGPLELKESSRLPHFYWHQDCHYTAYVLYLVRIIVYVFILVLAYVIDSEVSLFAS